MSASYLHNHKDFKALISIIAEEISIIPSLVEKDYWIMHVLYGLKKQDFKFELKGGTSLSKGFRIIDRFSEDIDIHITPTASAHIDENPKSDRRPENALAKKGFYDSLAESIKINGIISVIRDVAFDNTTTYNSGGIRLTYKTLFDEVEGIKEGILLEAGFDTVTPNQQVTISSWAYEKAIQTGGIEIIDNTAKAIPCYAKGYTFVEKLQTITNKFRKEQSGEKRGVNFMRQYYDIYCLLGDEGVQEFIGSQDYIEHKEKRFRGADRETPIRQNEAFLLNDPALRKEYIKRYKETAALYYNGQPDFEDLLERIKANIERL